MAERMHLHVGRDAAASRDRVFAGAPRDATRERGHHTRPRADRAAYAWTSSFTPRPPAEQGVIPAR
jgi:hypothetical protein